MTPTALSTAAASERIQQRIMKDISRVSNSSSPLHMALHFVQCCLGPVGMRPTAQLLLKHERMQGTSPAAV